jgi:anaerobic ribonucleoside-triphosphate reductase
MNNIHTSADFKTSNDSCTNEKLQLADSERQPCEVWTRVMGYHRPVSSFNCGKKGEFEERTYFAEERASLG